MPSSLVFWSWKFDVVTGEGMLKLIQRSIGVMGLTIRHEGSTDRTGYRVKPAGAWGRAWRRTRVRRRSEARAEDLVRGPRPSMVRSRRVLLRVLAPRWFR